MKVLAKNKRATFDYAIEGRISVGIVLSGHEVKSIRAGEVSLNGSFIGVNRGELWLRNAHINLYKHSSLTDYDPTRTRKLLAHKKEIAKLQALKLNGYHIVPIAIGLNKQHVKLEIGYGHSQKRTDKRVKIKRSDTDRDTERYMKNR